MAWFRNPFRKEEKESATGIAVAQFVNGQAIYTPREYESLSKEGYIRNVITFRCINLIAQSAASVPWILSANSREVERHPFIDLLRKPNPMQRRADLIERLAAFYLIAGNAYLEGTKLGERENTPPIELYSLRPDRMKIIGGKTGIPSKYRYTANGVEVDFAVDPISGRSPRIYHMKAFHPTNDWYGLAPIEAAAFAIDQHNAAGEHNAALLQNRATPAGTLVLKTDPGEVERDRLKQLLMDRYASPKNAGKPLLLGGDVEWTEMGLTPKELDFNASLASVARDICNAFHVPHVLIVPGQSTYRNMEEARVMLWEDAVIPMLDKLQGALQWVAESFAPNLEVEYNLDGIAALMPRRVLHREAVISEYQAGIITKNEARDALQYDPDPDGDSYFGESAGSGPSDTPDNNADDGNDTSGKSALAPQKKGFVEQMLAFAAPEEIDDPTLSANVSEFLLGIFGRIVRKYGEDVVREIGERASFENSAKVQTYISNSTGTLIQNVNETTKKKIRKQVSDAFANQETVDDIRARIEAVFVEASTVRARNIAVTESTRLAGFASDEAISQSGVEYKEWLATMDGSTRDAHSRMDGQVVSKGGKFTAPGGQQTDHPGGFGIARLDINCFLPNTKVSGEIVAASKAVYSGKAVKLQTASGNSVSVTPNHPILTRNGFVAAASLRKGDYVLGYRRKIDLSIPVSEQNIYDADPTAEQIFATLHRRFPTMGVDISFVNFHGDAKGIKENVDVIFTHRPLIRGYSASDPSKLGDDPSLATPDFSGALGSTLTKLGFPNLSATGSEPGSAALLPDSRGVILDGFPLQAFRFGASPYLNSSLYEVPGKSLATETSLIAELLKADTGEIFDDEVIEIVDFEFSGHVYDFQSVSGILNAGGVLSSNCRCAIAASFPDKSAKAMTEVERRELWDLREKRRKGHENEILESFGKIFTMQREAIMKKIDAITGET